MKTVMMRRKFRYRLQWASGTAPNAALKWAVYDWSLICAVAYAESRAAGRQLCNFLNRENNDKVSHV